MRSFLFFYPNKLKLKYLNYVRKFFTRTNILTFAELILISLIMIKLPRLLVLLFTFITITAVAQSKNTRKTDVNRDVDVVKVFEQVVKEGYGTPYIYKELANAYYFKNEHLKAKKWFEKLFEVEKPLDATLKHRYRQTLKALKLEFKNNRYLAVGGSN